MPNIITSEPLQQSVATTIETSGGRESSSVSVTVQVSVKQILCSYLYSAVLHQTRKYTTYQTEIDLHTVNTKIRVELLIIKN